MSGTIHSGNPFVPEETERDPVRRLRGRLPVPVTVVTSGAGATRTGLTVSSLVVAEGDPGRVYFLVSPTTDLFDEIRRTGRFVVHALRREHRELSDVFAGIRPSPGGLFTGLEVVQSDWGPVLRDIANRAFCSYASGVEESYSILAGGTIDAVEVGDLTDPLVYFRGEYRSLDRRFDEN